MFYKDNAETQDDVMVDVRFSMSRLPKFLQWFLTWLTGKPLEGQKPLIKRTNLSHLVTAYAWFLSGISIAMFAHSEGYYMLLPFGWLFTVSGARKLITTINHYASPHGDFLPLKYRTRFGWVQKYIADFNSSILFLQDAETYKIEHLDHHKIDVVASIVDPDMAFMWQLGFKAGMDKSKLWKVLICNLFFPFSKLHRMFFISRLKTVIHKTTWFRFIIQTITLVVLVVVIIKTSFLTMLLAILLPMTYFYHMASLLQFASEHLWLSNVETNGMLQKKGKHKTLVARSKRLTNARFCGEALNINVNDTFLTKTIKLIKWIFRMLFVHLPLRLFVLSGDLVVHDYHHRCGFGSDWANAFYTRAELAKKFKDTDAPLTEVWGLKNALDAVLENLSNLEPINPEFIEMDADAVLGM